MSHMTPKPTPLGQNAICSDTHQKLTNQNFFEVIPDGL